MRGIPIFTFVNKMDRAAKNPFDLMKEIEDVLGIATYPMNWPIGTDGDFKGVYHRKDNKIELFEAGDHGQTQIKSTTGTLDDDEFAQTLGSYYHERLKEEIELLDLASDEFDIERVLSGNLTPVFFGSAMTNFGVLPFLESFIKMAPCPSERLAGETVVDPVKTAFSGFIFKIQANMNPAHRDRLAFMRICSGKFEKGMEAYLGGTDRKVKLSQPTQFMAQERTIIDEAYAGDIIGLFDQDVFRIGDTITSGDSRLKYDDIPVFPSEHFARVTFADSMKRKQFQKGIEQLAQEGAIQVFKQLDYHIESLIIGAVGVLQFEVLEYRLKNEYNCPLKIQILPLHHARWITSPESDPRKLTLTSSTLTCEDQNGNFVLIFENEWGIDWTIDKNKGLMLKEING